MQTTENIIQSVTLKELETILANTPMVKGMGKIAHVTQLTRPKCCVNIRNTNPKVPFTGIIEKKSLVSIILNNEYKTVVTNQLKRENKPKTAYKKGKNTMVVDKSESQNNFFGYYTTKTGITLPVLEYKPNQGVKPKTTYFLNGNKVKKSALPDVLPKEYPAKNQGTDKEILWRKLYLSNVVELSIDGYTYKLVK